MLDLHDTAKKVFLLGLLPFAFLLGFFLSGRAPNEWLPFYMFLPAYFQNTPPLLYVNNVIILIFFVFLFGLFIYIVKEKI